MDLLAPHLDEDGRLVLGRLSVVTLLADHPKAVEFEIVPGLAQGLAHQQLEGGLGPLVLIALFFQLLQLRPGWR